MFGINSSVNESTSHTDHNGFNICNLQKFISRALKQPLLVQVEKPKKEEYSSDSNSDSDSSDSDSE